MILLPLLLAAGLALAGGAHAGVEEDADPVLLVARAGMPDPNFAQAVVLVAFPQDSGPMGVILNRPADMTIGELFGPDRPELREVPDPVFFGGPVQPDGMLFIFRSGEHPIRALPLVDDLYLSGDGAVFERLVADTADGDNRRFFAGFANWAEGQLDREIARGDWHVLRVDAETVLARDTETLWARLLKRATSQSARGTPLPPLPAGRKAPPPRGGQWTMTGVPVWP